MGPTILRILLWKYKASLYILPPEFNIRSKVLLEKVKQNKNIFGTDHMSPRIFHMHTYEKIYKNKINKILTSEEISVKRQKERMKSIIEYLARLICLKIN